MMWQLLFAVLWLIPTMTFGATIYIDRTLASNCTAVNYSVANRNCSGSNGNAYRDIQSALSASSNGDTITIRAGSYTSNVASSGGIQPKAGQTWQGYLGESVTIRAAAAHAQVFHVGASNVTVQDLTLIGGTINGVYMEAA